MTFLELMRARLGLLFALLAVPSLSAHATDVPGTLKVHVDVPAAWSLLLDEHVAERLVDRLRDALYRHGFDRPVEAIRSVDDPHKLPLLLTLELQEWRIRESGAAECTLVASLQTPTDRTRVGSYTYAGLQPLGSGRFGLSRSFVAGNDDVFAALCRDLARTGLLPSLRAPRA